MTDIPIIFSAPMVLALLAGRKTMTRRLAWREIADPQRRMAGWTDSAGKRWARTSWQAVNPGDRLWVRETFARNADQVSDDRMDTSVMYAADGKGRAVDNGSPPLFPPDARGYGDKNRAATGSQRGRFPSGRGHLPPA